MALEVELKLKRKKTHTLSILDGVSYLEAFSMYLILNPISPCVQMLSQMFRNSFSWDCKFKTTKTLAPGAEEYRDFYVDEDKLLLIRIFF